MIELHIPEATMSLNYLHGSHWSRCMKARKRWKWLVRAARLEARVFLQQPLQKAKVTITRYGRRICDTDNLVGGTKILTDTLVKEGLLANDTPSHIELIVLQHLTKTPQTPHTVVLIEAA